ncbi:MAG: hypothetical protein AMJ46_08385 [Latescibacteria bacterium DG_63]|nr:MAG: hypothetical protein AMJ46_08385 [Latescibacteria bacterium DG_63]
MSDKNGVYLRFDCSFRGGLVCACLLALLLLLYPGPSSAAFAPAHPEKKGLKYIEERHGLEPKLLLKDRDAFAVTSLAAVADTTTLKVLALLVDFPDFSFMHDSLFVERHLLFLTQFYSIVSSGKLQLEITTSDPVFTLPKSMEHYGQDDDIGLRLVELTQDAVAAADSLIDFTLYDEVILLHAGLGQEADIFGDSPEQIWSAMLGPAEFEYYLPDSLEYPGIATNDTLPGGEIKYIDRIAIVPEDEAQDNWPLDPLGVYAHEFGHVLGLPDLYDTTPYGGSDSQGIGNWGLMGTGLWNANGYSPAEPCAWSKAVLGWKPVRVVSAADTLELSFSSGLNESGEILLIPIGGREYFLVENRLQDLNGNLAFDFDDTNSDGVLDIYEDSYDGAEFDYFLPGIGTGFSSTGSGLLIWHIDEQQVEAGMPYNMVNADPFHKGVDLEEADSIEDLDEPGFTLEDYGSAFDSFREDNNASFTPFTVPNSDGSFGGRSHVFIEDIGPPGQLMSFRVSFGMRKENWPVSARASFGTNHPNASDLDGDGIPELIACDTAGNLYVLEADGTTYLNPGLFGAPIRSLGEEVLSSPAVGDIDGDGLDEVVVVAASGTVFAWNGGDFSEVTDGDDDPGTEGILCLVHPTGETKVVVSDLGGDGTDEIMFGSSLPDTTLFLPEILGASGEVVAASAALDSCFHFYTLRVETDSVRIGDLVFAGPTFRAPVSFDFNEDGRKETVVPTGVGDGLGRLHLIYICVCYLAPSSPQICTCPALTGVEAEFNEIALADLDRDGEQEVVGVDVAGRLHVMHVSVQSRELTELPGWPVELVAHEIAAVSIGEIDDDGRLEILASCGGEAFAFNYNGTMLPFWPPPFPGRDWGLGRPHAPLCVDVTGDNTADFVGGVSDGRLVAMRSDASSIDGWPLMAGSSSGASPLMLDMDGDNSVELVTVRDVGVEDSLSGEIDIWEIEAAFQPTLAWWPSYRRDPAHSGAVPDSLSLPTVPAAGILTGLFAMPNPAKGESVTLHYTLAEGVDRVSIEIYDLSGRLVHSASPCAFAASDNNYTLELGPFSSGVYVWCVEAVSGSGASDKIFSKFAIVK